MKAKLIVGLMLFLTSALIVPQSEGTNAPGASAAGPNDFDRFRHQSPPPEKDGRTDSQQRWNLSRIYFNRGNASSRKGDERGAIREYDEALKLDPKFAHAYFNRARSYEIIGNIDHAIADYGEAIRCGTNSFYDRGRLYLKRDNWDKALVDLNKAIRLNPNEANAYGIRGAVYIHLGNFGKALADYDKVIRLARQDAKGYSLRGRAHDARGDYSAAASDLAKAEQMDSGNEHVLNRVAWFKATCPESSFRNGQEAVRESAKACQLTKWENARDIDTLAAAYAETGDFDQAVKYEVQALNTTGVSAGTRREMEERLRLFQEHKPYREESKLRQARTKSAG
jgi:tetratricopeptide (TPR) repeat protein